MFPFGDAMSFSINMGIIAGVAYVYGMALGIIMLFSGLFNIDSLGGFALQAVCLIYLFFLWKQAEKSEANALRLQQVMIGFCIGSFIGLTFVSIGVWHGVTPAQLVVNDTTLCPSCLHLVIK